MTQNCQRDSARDIKTIGNGLYHYHTTINRLGQGVSGSVYLGWVGKDESNKIAIKVISRNSFIPADPKNEYEVKKSKKIIGYILSEIQCLKQISKHTIPYTLKMIDCKETQNNIYLITEFCNNGSLIDQLKKTHYKAFPEKQAVEILYQIILG